MGGQQILMYEPQKVVFFSEYVCAKNTEIPADIPLVAKKRKLLMEPGGRILVLFFKCGTS